MTGFGVKKRLLRTVQGIPVPDVWGEIKDAPMEKAEIPVRRGYFAIACVLSACVLVAVTASLLIPGFAAGWNNDLSLTGGLETDGDYAAKGEENADNHGMAGEAVVSTAPEIGEEPTALQWLSARQYHGELRQTTLSADHVSSFLTADFDLENVYEDETYLYAFESGGALKEMVNTSDGLGSGTTSESAIRSAVALSFEQYLPDENLSEYEITIDFHADAYPAWTVKAKKYDAEIVVSNVSLAFDSDGNLLRLTAPEKPDITGVTMEESYTGALSLLSHKDAVKIALEEAKKEEYGFIIPEDYTASIETKTKIEAGETVVYYSVEIGNLPLKSSPCDTQSLLVNINAQTGKVMNVEKSMILAGVDLPPEP